MNDTGTSRPPIGLWAMIALALILSVTSIVLHVTTVGGNRSRFDSSSDEYQQLSILIQQYRAEHNKMQAALAGSANFNQFRQSMNLSGQPFTPPPPISAQTDSPMAALMVLEQSRMRNSFDDYQQIHPKDQQKVLEQIFMTNRELKFAYEELKNQFLTRYLTDEFPTPLAETESERLGRLLFRDSNQYVLLETNKINDAQAELKVKVRIDEEKGNLTTFHEVTLKAIKEGTNWKVADHPNALAHHEKVLARMKQRLKDCKSISQRCIQGELKTIPDFNKAWEAIAKDE